MNQERNEDLEKDVELIVKEKTAIWWTITTRLGMDSTKINNWCDIFKSQIIDICDHMIAEVTRKQNELLNELETLLQKAQKLCNDLGIKLPECGGQELNLNKEKEFLTKKIEEFEDLLSQKQKEVRFLNKEEEKLCLMLGQNPNPIDLLPLASLETIQKFKSHIDDLELKKFERVEEYFNTKTKILELVDKLKFEPTLDFERIIIHQDNDDFLLTDDNMVQLHNFHTMLQVLYTDTKDEIAHLREKINSLWQVLAENLQYCSNFLENYTGNSLTTLKALKMELARCEDLRRVNIERFVTYLRDELKTLWDKCHLTPEERENFEYFHTSLFTEDLLSLHDIEINKMKTYYSSNSELFVLLNKHSELWSKMKALEERSTAPNRFKNRGGQLLKEEKERNAVCKLIPKMEEQLLQLSEKFEKEHGKSFTSWGKTVGNILDDFHKNYEEEKQQKLSSRKLKRENTLTPGKSVLTSYASAQNLAFRTPRSDRKRKIITPTLKQNNKRIAAPQTAPPKLLKNGKPMGRSRYSIERAKRLAKCRKISYKMQLKQLNKENVSSTEYDVFEKDLDSKESCRSTLFLEPTNTSLAQPLPATPKKPIQTNVAVTPHRPGTSRQHSPHPTTKKLTMAVHSNMIL